MNRKCAILGYETGYPQGKICNCKSLDLPNAGNKHTNANASYI